MVDAPLRSQRVAAAVLQPLYACPYASVAALNLSRLLQHESAVEYVRKVHRFASAQTAAASPPQLHASVLPLEHRVATTTRSRE